MKTNTRSPKRLSSRKRQASKLPSMPLGRRILHDVLALPTAPFAEQYVLSHIEKFCRARNGVTIKRDRAGNLLARVRQGGRKVKHPVCITAHTDHPGFVAVKMLSRDSVRAYWRGGVPPAYFKGGRVRFHVDGRWVRGVIKSTKVVRRLDQQRVDTARIEVSEKIPAGAIGMWDFPDPRERGSRIYARGCDDLAGVAAMLAAIDGLARRRISCDAFFLFTRAEEVGFIGAIEACHLNTIPRRCLVVAMETSSELPNARMGDGPILRIGDRASTFTPAATAYAHRVARELARSDRSFRYQRKLMDGGTCESSAYCTLGYQATGICIALGNYHNVNRKRKTLGPEYVDLDDYDNVVKWFVELARAPFAYTGRDDTLDDRLQELRSTYKGLLSKTAGLSA